VGLFGFEFDELLLELCCYVVEGVCEVGEFVVVVDFYVFV